MESYRDVEELIKWGVAQESEYYKRLWELDATCRRPKNLHLKRGGPCITSQVLTCN